MVQQLGKEPSTRLLKHVVRCYLRLSDNLRYAFICFSDYTKVKNGDF